MTCIVGFVDKNNDIYIGGDSAGVSRMDIRIRSDAKVFERNDMLFGYTSSFRMGQLLRFKLNIPPQPNHTGDYEYVCTLFIDEVRKCLKENGYTTVKDNEEKIGEFIIGYRDNLYHVESDLQVGMVADSYDACGCGENYALGSLATNKDINAREIVLKALEVAEKFSAGVRRPFVVVTLTKE